VARAQPPPALLCLPRVSLASPGRAKAPRATSGTAIGAGAAGPGMPPWQRSIRPSTVRLSDLGLPGPTKASNPFFTALKQEERASPSRNDPSYRAAPTAAPSASFYHKKMESCGVFFFLFPLVNLSGQRSRGSCPLCRTERALAARPRHY